MRLHQLYAIVPGSEVYLRPQEIEELRLDVVAQSDEDLVFEICFVCSEAMLVGRSPGVGATSATYAEKIGPMCQALLAQMGTPFDATLEFVRHAVLGNRYISTTAPIPDEVKKP